MMTSSPGLTSACVRLKITCLPPAPVYLVKFCSIAHMAAFLILSGVGKSGSPAPKSTTSTPCVRSFSASAATFIVDETLISEMRSAISVFSSSAMVSCLRARPDCCADGAESFEEPCFHRRRYQPLDIATQPDDFFYQARTDERMRLARHQEQRLNLRAKPAVH